MLPGAATNLTLVRLRSITRRWRMRSRLALWNSRRDRSPLRSLQVLQFSPLLHCKNAVRSSDHFADIPNKFFGCNRQIVHLLLIGRVVQLIGF